MTRRIVVNKNYTSSSANTISPGSLFDGKYGKQEIVIDNRVGQEGIHIISENGRCLKIPVDFRDIAIYSGLTEDQIREIVYDFAEHEMDAQFAPISLVTEIKNQLENRDDEIESQIIPEERIAEIAEEAATNAVQDLPTVSDENIANIRSLLDLLRNNEEVIADLKRALDYHVLLSESQYAELIASGSTTLDNGKHIIYDAETYYNIYEDDLNPDDGEGTIDGGDEDGISLIVSFDADDTENDVLLISRDAEIEIENNEPVLVI